MPDRRPPLTTLVNEGKAIAANTPITAITIIISASEKPRTPAHGGEPAIGTARDSRCGLRSPHRFWSLRVSRTQAQTQSLSDQWQDMLHSRLGWRSGRLGAGRVRRMGER